MRNLLTLLLFVVVTAPAIAQDSTAKAPYQKFSGFPPIKLLLPDSSHYFTKDDLPKKKPIMLILFSPMCEHCQHETELLTQNMDKFKDVEIVMATSNPFDSMRHFIDRYGLAKYDNVVVSYDPQFFLIEYFQIHNLPTIAFYDRKRKFVSLFEGSIPIEQALEELNKESAL